MESLSPQVVSAAKLPILNSNEFDLWKMRIEQYLLMNDYSLWDVILNGDSPIPTRARGTLLMALPDKHQLKFNIHKDAKSLMEAIEKRFGGNKETKKKLISQLEILGESLSQEDINLKFLRSLPTEWRTHTLIWRNKTDLEDQSLDDLFNSLKIYEAVVKSPSSTSPPTQNITFVPSQNTDNTNESVSAVTSVSAASTKVLVSALPNIAMLTMRARRFLQRNECNLGANGTTSIGFDMSKVKCYNYHRRGHFTRECRSPKDTRNKETQRKNVLVETSTSNALVSQYDGVGSYDWSFQADEAPTNYALMAFTSSSSSCFDNENENVFEEDIKLLKLDVMLRDKALVDLRKKFEKAEQERDELKLKLEKFQTSSKNLSQLLASQTTDKTGLGYDNQVFHSTVFDSDELLSFESDASMPTSLVYDRYKLGEGYHAVPPPYTGTFMPPKPDLIFHDAPTINETVLTVLPVEPSTTKPNKDCDYYEKKMVQKPVRNNAMKGNHQNYARMTHPHPYSHVVPTSVLTRSRLVPLTATRPVTTATNQVDAVKGVKGNWIQVSYGLGPQKTLTFLFDVQGNPQHALKNKGVIDSGCLRHMTRNISYFSDFEEINEGYVAFCGNPKGGKITGKFDRKADEGFLVGYSVSSKAFRVFNSQTRIVQKTLHINFLENQPNVTKSRPTWLFDIDTLTHSMNYQPVVAGNQPNSSAGIQEHFNADKAGEGNVQQYVLFPLWSTGSKDPQNTDANATFKVKEPESEVHVSPSSCDKPKKHDDKTKREAKGKSPVDTPITAGKPNSTNSTNTFSAAGPSNNAVSSNFKLGGKSSYVDSSQYPYDPDMPALEDITYSDDEYLFR
nr:hypothetical protein [Tanacetum cinerariifolium]